jgi:hypothetical protein
MDPAGVAVDGTGQLLHGDLVLGGGGGADLWVAGQLCGRTEAPARRGGGRGGQRRRPGAGNVSLALSADSDNDRIVLFQGSAVPAAPGLPGLPERVRPLLAVRDGAF